MTINIKLNLLDGEPINGLCTLGAETSCWPVFLMLDYRSGLTWLQPLEPGATPMEVVEGRRSMWKLATTPSTAEACDLLRKLEPMLQTELKKRGKLTDEIQEACDNFFSQWTFFLPSEFFELAGEDAYDVDGESVDVWEAVCVEYEPHGTVDPDTTDEELESLESSILTPLKTDFIVGLGDHLREIRESCRKNA